MSLQGRGDAFGKHVGEWPALAAKSLFRRWHLLFNAAGFILLYIFLRTQQWLPVNPQRFGPMTPDQALDTAVSFGTITNWQSYSCQKTLPHFSQMFGLTVQNFLSAATGIALAVVRGRAARSAARNHRRG